MRWRAAVSVLFTFVLVWGGGHVYYRTTPQHALDQIDRALTTRDPVLFEKYVDVESVLDAAVDDLLALAAADSTHADSVINAEPTSTDAHELKPALTEMAQDALIGELLGNGAGTRSLRSRDNVSFRDVTNHSSLSRAALRSVLGVEHNGHLATARVLLQEIELDTALVLTLALEKRDGVWTFVEIPNLAQYVRTVGELQQRRLAQEGARGRVFGDWAEYLQARRQEAADPTRATD